MHPDPVDEADDAMAPQDVANMNFAGLEGLPLTGEPDSARRADETLRNAQYLNTLILNSSRDCIVVLDLEGHTQYVSPGGIESMEVADVEAILGLSWLRVWKDGDHDAAVDAVAQARAGGVGRFQGFCPTHRGRPKWWDVVISSLPGPDGRPDRLVSVGRDITQLRQTEQRLASIEERLALALGASSMLGIWDWDLASDRVYADANFARMFGVDPVQAADGVSLGTFVKGMHPEDRERIGVAIKRATETTEEYEEEFRVIGADGQQRWVSARGRCRNDADGHPSNFPGVMIDITARKRAEDALALSVERLRLALQAGRLGDWDLDLVNNTATRSARHDEIFGYDPPRPDWSYDVFAQHVVEEDRERVALAFTTAFEQRVPWAVECRIRRVDGEIRWIDVRGLPAQNPAGEVVRALGIVADVTERKSFETALAESEARLQGITNSVDQMIWSTQPDGFHDFYNQRWYDYTGVPTGSTDGEAWSGMFHPDDQERAWSVWRHSLATGEPYHIEYRLRHSSGQYRWVLGRAQAVRDEAGRITRWYGTCTDIQEIVEARDVLARSREELERMVEERTAELMAVEDQLRQSQKMEAVGQLTGGLAHDFNNLLIGITGSLELLQRRIAQGRISEVDRYVKAAQGAARRAASLTHRLLAFSRRQTLDPKPADINRLIREMEELIRRTMGPSIEVEVVGSVGLWITLVDTNQLENALLNLCINARDAMPDGGRLTIETANKWLDERAARDRDLPPGQYLSLCVTDTGTGMTREVIERAFDPFFTTKPIGMGTGLGLSMVYGFARQSDGQVRIDSEVGTGTTMCLYLPCKHGAEATEETAAPHVAARAEQGQTVLVVDDEQTIRMLVTEVLQELGFATLEASDGASGLAILRSDTRIDLLITDVGLPGGINGRQVADAGRVVRPDLKVLFVTGYAENTVVGNGHFEPGMQILTKPFTIDALADRVKDLVGHA